MNYSFKLQNITMNIGGESLSIGEASVAVEDSDTLDSIKVMKAVPEFAREMKSIIVDAMLETRALSEMDSIKFRSPLTTGADTDGDNDDIKSNYDFIGKICVTHAIVDGKKKKVVGRLVNAIGDNLTFVLSNADKLHLNTKNLITLIRVAEPDEKRDWYAEYELIEK